MDGRLSAGFAFILARNQLCILEHALNAPAGVIVILGRRAVDDRIGDASKLREERAFLQLAADRVLFDQFREEGLEAVEASDQRRIVVQRFAPKLPTLESTDATKSCAASRAIALPAAKNSIASSALAATVILAWGTSAVA